MVKRIRPKLLGISALVLVMGAAGCQFGPSALTVGSAHYSDAVRIATSEQLLVNLVRLRYRDLSIFLGVSNISTQFQFNSSAGIDGSIVENVNAGKAKTPDTLGLSGSVAYSEKPTITFSILGGEAFQKRMLSPLKVGAISLLAESGWRADRVLRLTVEELNGMKNAPGASGPTPSRTPAYRDFLEFTELLRELHEDGLINFEYETREKSISSPLPAAQVKGADVVTAAKVGIEFQATDDGQHLGLVARKRVLVMRFAPQDTEPPKVARFRELARLKPGQMRFDIVALEHSEMDPFKPQQRVGDIAVDTRSLMGVLYYLANGVKPPPAHLEAGLVTTTVDALNHPFDWSNVLDGLFQVHSSVRRPSHAAVAVRHRGYWFYILDSDESSKSTFTLLSQLFALQASDVDEVKPLLTLPVGN
ncbi:MAG: hypothetical protein ACE5GE_12600 [Phycisphaerae bacterium]